MANIWSKLLKSAFSPIIDEEVNEKLKKIKEDVVASSLAKQVSAISVPNGFKSEPRNFAKGIGPSTLREFSLYYPILRACINYRKRQINQLSWEISPIKVIVDKTKKEAATKEAEVIKKFFNYPTGDKTISFRTFCNKIIEDLMVLDAVAIYRRQTRGGKLLGYLPIDASTIELIVNSDGTTPNSPQKAYVQKINGKVVTELTVDELIYRVMNPRTETPYGLSLVETLILVVTTALKLSSFNLSYLTEGNVPEGFIELPKDIASNQDQLNTWQVAWDAMLAGDPRYQRKIKFLPEGMKWNPIRKPEDMEFERFEKWLLMQTCSVMEVAPQAIGFDFERGKGAAETEWEIGKERGQYPLANLLKELFDHIIQEDMGNTDFEFAWTNINPTNRKEEADVFAKLVNTGAVSIDEWRLGEGLEPVGCPPYVMTPVGPIFVHDLVSMSQSGNPILPGSYSLNNPTPTDGTKPKTAPSTDKPSTNVKTKEEPTDKKSAEQTKKFEIISRNEVVDELKRWKRAALNDMKQSKDFRDFKTVVIDPRTQKIIRDALVAVKGRDELNDLFDPFITRENQIVTSVMELYDNIVDIVKDEQNTIN
jgi:hypothetical protein